MLRCDTGRPRPNLLLLVVLAAAAQALAPHGAAALRIGIASFEPGAGVCSAKT